MNKNVNYFSFQNANIDINFKLDVFFQKKSNFHYVNGG